MSYQIEIFGIRRKITSAIKAILKLSSCTSGFETISLWTARSDEAHQEGVRRRLLYIHEGMKIYCYRSIVSIDASIEKYCKN